MVHAVAQMARSLARKDDDHVTWCSLLVLYLRQRFLLNCRLHIFFPSRRYVWFIGDDVPVEQGAFSEGARHNRVHYNTAAVELKEQQGGHV